VLAFTVDPAPAITPQALWTILDAIGRVITARVHCTPTVADAIALWVVCNWGVFPPHDAAAGVDLFPFLHISSPTPRCGKSTLLDTAQFLVRRPLQAADVSGAALYRVIEKHRPTMLIDEFDQLIKKLPDLIGILNSAHTRSGSVIRTVEVQAAGIRTFEPTAFSTFAPIVLAGIGAAPSTVQDRSIRIRLERQPHGARRRRVGRRNMLHALRNQLAPHLLAHADSIGAAMAKGVADNSIPPSLNDRAADNWAPLLAVADLAGGAWPGRAYRAAAALCDDGAADEHGPEGTLCHVVDAVEERRREVVTEYLAWRRQGRKTVNPLPGRRGKQQPKYFRFIMSDDLSSWLMAKDDSGFSDLRDIGAAKLRVARRLRPFGIAPTLRKIDGQPARGYDVLKIRAAWRRYRP
jgi:hypothetical protein